MAGKRQASEALALFETRAQTRTTPVRRTPMSLSRRFFQICTAAAADALVAEELTPMESGVLAYLNRVTGEPNIDQNSLAERMGIDRSHASLLVERLVTRRLIDRQINPENRRAHILKLTPAGEKASSTPVAPTSRPRTA